MKYLQNTLIFLIYLIAGLSIPLIFLLISDFSGEKVFYHHVLRNITVYSYLAFCLPLSGMILKITELIRGRFEKKGLYSTSYYSGAKSLTAREAYGELAFEISNFRKFKSLHMAGLPLTIGLLLIIQFYLLTDKIHWLFFVAGVTVSSVFYVLRCIGRRRCFVREESLRECYSNKSYNIDESLRKIKFDLSLATVAGFALLLLAYISIIYDFLFFVLLQLFNTNMPGLAFDIFYFTLYANFYLLIFYFVVYIDSRQ